MDKLLTKQGLLTKEQVKCLVAGKGTKIATVTFVKADGSIRKVNGLFKPSSKIVGSDRGIAQGEAMKARGQVPVYELATGQWKSFYADKVLEIK
jgi:hypothetical protein